MNPNMNCDTRCKSDNEQPVNDLISMPKDTDKDDVPLIKVTSTNLLDTKRYQGA